jgi:hypothetical protein
MRQLLADKAGFRGNGPRVIVDENLPSSWAESLRANGYDARSIAEMGITGAKDSQIKQLAEQLAARVLTHDRGRQLDGGFGPLSVLVDGRITGVDAVLRLLGGG